MIVSVISLYDTYLLDYPLFVQFCSGATEVFNFFGTQNGDY